MFRENPDGITIRVQKVLIAAGFRDEEEEAEIVNEADSKGKSDAPIDSDSQNGVAIVRGTFTLREKKDYGEQASVTFTVSALHG